MSDNSEKLDAARARLQDMRAKARGKIADLILSRDFRVLDALTSKVNGHSVARANEQTPSVDVAAITKEFEALKAELMSEREKRSQLEEELQRRGFSVRVG